MSSQKVTVGKSESVRVLIRSKGGGTIFIAAYGDRSPSAVAASALRLLDAKHAGVLAEHFQAAGTDPRDYANHISWKGCR